MGDDYEEEELITVPVYQNVSTQIYVFSRLTVWWGDCISLLYVCFHLQCLLVIVLACYQKERLKTYEVVF